jgi:xylulokinase
MKKYIIGIDLGTGSCKIAILNAQARKVHTATVAYRTATPHPGWAEQNPADWITAVCAAVKASVAEADIAGAAIAGIAMTSAAHIGVLLDKDQKPLRPAILWNDQRTLSEVSELENQAGDFILNTSGQAVSTGWTLPHLLWIRKNEPDIWRRLYCIRLSKDYLIEWLTGKSLTDPATAVSTQLYNIKQQAWSSELCALAGVNPEMLPRIEPVSAFAGGLCKSAAAALGLTTGTPVINGTLDSATELLAAGICRPGGGMIRLATAGGIQITVPEPVPARRCITYPHAITPVWYCQAGTNTCASAVQWAIQSFSGSQPDAADWQLWDTEAGSAPPGSADLLFHPYLAGERAPHWDPQLRGSFIGLSLAHDRGHLARAVYEGTAFSIRDAMVVMPNTLLSGNKLLAVAGGGCRSTLWVKILANVLGQPLRPLPDADSATGAALIGLNALAMTTSDLETIAENRADNSSIIQPDPELCNFYTAVFEEYIDLHRRLTSFYGKNKIAKNGKDNK